jgi:hypothetical protein
VNEVICGLARITFQMGVSALPHEKMLRSIELLGTHVAPIVGKELAAVTSRSRSRTPVHLEDRSGTSSALPDSSEDASMPRVRNTQAKRQL